MLAALVLFIIILFHLANYNSTQKGPYLETYILLSLWTSAVYGVLTSIAGLKRPVLCAIKPNPYS
jgi:multisubunit Na+/H+ antiporter MnhC subunit